MTLKTEIKNVKVAKIVKFIKTCDQYRRKFNFGKFFISIILPFSAGENRFSKNAVPGKWIIPFCLGFMIRTWERLISQLS